MGPRPHLDGCKIRKQSFISWVVAPDCRPVTNLEANIHFPMNRPMSLIGRPCLCSNCTHLQPLLVGALWNHRVASDRSRLANRGALAPLNPESLNLQICSFNTLNPQPQTQNNKLSTEICRMVRPTILQIIEVDAICRLKSTVFFRLKTRFALARSVGGGGGGRDVASQHAPRTGNIPRGKSTDPVESQHTLRKVNAVRKKSTSSFAGSAGGGGGGGDVPPPREDLPRPLWSPTHCILIYILICICRCTYMYIYI